MRVTESEIKAWKDHPTTAKVLKFLGDVRESLKEDWASGQIGQENPYPQVRAHTYGEILEIDAAMIMNFYEESEESQDG